MSGISLDDIVKLLNQIPIWRSVSALPKRVRELEERVAALELKPMAKSAATCPLCGGETKTVKVEPNVHFGTMGMQDHTLVCGRCEHIEIRQIDTMKG
ncbi:hypothetical protein [Methylobacterium brachiatum]|uniref:hypothetical protein n=1 Tax=Methylobacterium brachiatum TaxID=269660 RepID=UPI002449B9D8|nr:hypothetical protein [Methylobacterium brachiatum]MDH2311454.1 hypothetical protein [Methylobacterium brachiatum]